MRVTNIRAQHITRRIGISNREVTSKLRNSLMDLMFRRKACKMFVILPLKILQALRRNVRSIKLF